MSEPILHMDRVSASYSTYRALFGVTLSIPADGIVALVGSNGAGKSTVARVATGLVPVSDGSVRIAGEDITKLSAHRIARMGVTHVPEGRAVFSSLSVEENLTLSFLKRVGRRGVSDALARAYDAFPVLSERRRQQGGTLSGGQQRILSLAKVLAVAPKLLVVDELSLGLAPVVVDQVYDGLVAIHRQGCALLVVEQQVDRALAIADTAVLLVKGAVAWEGPASQARPVLESQMLSGASTNGSAHSTNGSAPGAAAAVHAPFPTTAAPTVGPATVPGTPAAYAPMYAPPQPAAVPPPPRFAAPPPPPAAPAAPPPAAAAPSSPDATPSDANGHPADLWVVGPNFPVTPS
ncbi:MAG: ABC transporter ATP-binding protein [Acidimicrobiales bacterium]|jgi:branched-chain amino acid transport system ATP-binding protein